MNGQEGITLIEACVTLAVATVVATGAIPSMQQLLDARRFDGAASQLAGDLQFTRISAVARNQRIRFTLQTDATGSCYVIHTGNADACRCGSSGPAVCGSGANEIRTVRLPASDRVLVQANVASILFDPVHGTSTPAESSGVKSARRAVDLIETFAANDVWLSLSDLHARTGFPRSSLHGLLRTLLEAGWLEADANTARYRLGVRALICGTAYLDRDAVVPFATEALERICEAYYSLGLDREAQTAAAVLGRNYPGSGWYRAAYNILRGRNLKPEEDKGSWISQAFKKVF